MLLYIMLYIVLAYLMLFAALTNAVCLNNASSFFSFFFLIIFVFCQGYELSGEIALKNNHYYYYIHQHTFFKYMIQSVIEGKKSGDKYVCIRYSPIKQN